MQLPLGTLLAFYNEALVTMFAGFHPDAYWDQADVLKKRKDVSSVDEMVDDDPLLVPELPGEEHPVARPSSAIPQSVDDSVSLQELRQMIDSQASKIKKLHERMEKNSRPQTAP